MENSELENDVWDSFIESLTEFSNDFMGERNQPKLNDGDQVYFISQAG